MYIPRILQIYTLIFMTTGFLNNLRAAEQPEIAPNFKKPYASKVPLLQLEGLSISGEQGASYEDVSGEEYASFEELLADGLSEEELTYLGPINGFRGELKYHEEKKLYYYRHIDPSWTNVTNPEIDQKYSFRYDEETDCYYSCPKIVIQRATPLDHSINNKSYDQLSSGCSSYEDTSEEGLSPRTLIDQWKKSGSTNRLDFADIRYDERRSQFSLIDPDRFAQSPPLSDKEIIKNIISNGYTQKQAYAFIAAQTMLDNESKRINDSK